MDQLVSVLINFCKSATLRAIFHQNTMVKPPKNTIVLYGLSVTQQPGHQCYLFKDHVDTVAVWCGKSGVCVVSSLVNYRHHGGSTGCPVMVSQRNIALREGANYVYKINTNLLRTPVTSCSECCTGLSWTDHASRRNRASSSDSTEPLPARRYIPSERLPGNTQSAHQPK